MSSHLPKRDTTGIISKIFMSRWTGVTIDEMKVHKKGITWCMITILLMITSMNHNQNSFHSEILLKSTVSFLFDWKTSICLQNQYNMSHVLEYHSWGTRMYMNVHEHLNDTHPEDICLNYQISDGIIRIDDKLCHLMWCFRETLLSSHDDTTLLIPFGERWDNVKQKSAGVASWTLYLPLSGFCIRKDITYGTAGKGEKKRMRNEMINDRKMILKTGNEEWTSGMFFTIHHQEV